MTQGGTDHTSHRLVYYGLSETKAVALLALIAVALGATSVAYNVLDRPAVTALGVLVTFALLVQFGGFLAELSDQERRGRPGDTRLRHAVAVQPRRLAELLVDSTLVTGTFLVVYLLFVDGRGTELQRGTFLAVLPVLLGTTYVAYVLLGVYRRAWRYATVRDLATIALASALATLLAFGIVLATRDLGDFPPAIFLVYGVVAATLAAVSRWCVRLVPEAGGGPDDGRRRVLVVGAGQAGRGVARDLRGDGDARVVGFLDDNPEATAEARAGRARARDDCRCGRGALVDAGGRGRRHDPGRGRGPPGRSRTRMRGSRRPAAGRPRAAPAVGHTHAGDRGVSAQAATAAPRGHAGATSATRARVEELLPLVGAYLLLATLYAWQAWRRETPTIFSDELETTQISRAIADTGSPERRGDPYGFTSLVPWLTAPFWWLGPVASAYEAIKTVQAFVMAGAVFPAYLLARRV